MVFWSQRQRKTPLTMTISSVLPQLFGCRASVIPGLFVRPVLRPGPFPSFFGPACSIPRAPGVACSGPWPLHLQSRKVYYYRPPRNYLKCKNLGDSAKWRKQDRQGAWLAGIDCIKSASNRLRGSSDRSGPWSGPVFVWYRSRGRLSRPPGYFLILILCGIGGSFRM